MRWPIFQQDFWSLSGNSLTEQSGDFIIFGSKVVAISRGQWVTKMVFILQTIIGAFLVQTSNKRSRRKNGFLGRVAHCIDHRVGNKPPVLRFKFWKTTELKSSTSTISVASYIMLLPIGYECLISIPKTNDNFAPTSCCQLR